MLYNTLGPIHKAASVNVSAQVVGYWFVSPWKTINHPQSRAHALDAFSDPGHALWVITELYNVAESSSHLMSVLKQHSI